MNLEDMISHAHDEPDHAEDHSAATGVFGAALIGALIFAACGFAVLVLAFVASKVIA